MRTTVVGKPILEEDPQPADTSVVHHASTVPGRQTDPITGQQHRQPPPPVDRSTLVAEVAGVDKSFGPVQALERLNINVQKGRITVLLGPNGAGKTTAIRMITGAMTPDTGTVSVFGADPSGPSGEDIRRRCGVVSAKPSLYDRLSGLDNLRYAAELYDLGRGQRADDRIVEAAAQFGIDDALDQRVGGYSTGMKTRLALARSVLHDPDLLLLDEPTSGLDPESAQSVLGMVRDMTAGGRSVLMCTHLLLEAEGLADEVVIIQDGTSLMWGEPDELSSRYWPRPEVTITARAGTNLEPLRRHQGVVDMAGSGNRVRLELADDQVIGDLIHRLSAAGVHLEAVEPYRPSLEDLYFAVRREHRGGGPEQSGTAPPHVAAPNGDDQPNSRPDEPAATPAGRQDRRQRHGSSRELTTS